VVAENKLIEPVNKLKQGEESMIMTNKLLPVALVAALIGGFGWWLL